MIYLGFREEIKTLSYIPFTATNQIVIEKSEQELTDLLSDILEEGETWRN